MARSKMAPDAPYTVNDLMDLTGWSRPTVMGALHAGQLPGYQSKPGGKWTIPAEAFRAVANGTWTPQAKPVVFKTQPTVLHSLPVRKAS